MGSRAKYAILFVVLVALGAMAFAGVASVAQGAVYEWEWQNPLPQGNPLCGISALDASHAWAVGMGGTIVSCDGTGWSTQESGTTEMLMGVSALDSTHVWAVGENGTILFYDGTSWASQDSGTTSWLNGVSALDSTHVWAVGTYEDTYEGVILFYDGTTWSEQSNSSGELCGVSALDSSHVWAVGDGVLFFDGTDWGAQTCDAWVRLNGVSALDSGHVWAVEEARDMDGGGIIHFFNGTAWSEQATVGWGGSSLRGISAVDANHAWSVNDKGAIYFFNGTTWSEQYHGEGGDRLWGVSALDATHAWVSGFKGPTILYTSDGGTSWSEQTSGSTRDLVGVSAVDADHAWAVGWPSTILFYDGTSWSEQEGGTSNTLYGVYALDASHVWVVGEGGTILFYDGASWSEQESGTSNRLASVSALDSTHVWAVGSDGTIRFFDGISWTAQTSGTSQSFSSVSALDSTHIWAVGSNGTIRFFNGTSWSTQASGTSNTLNGIFALNDSQAWAVGSNGTILFYDGDSWAAQDSGSTAWLWGVSAIDYCNVWVADASETVLFYDGNSWSKQLYVPAAGVFALDADHVWIAGLNGSILRGYSGQTRNVSATASGTGGSVSPASQDVPLGGDATIYITSDPGYHIASIFDDFQEKDITNPYVITDVLDNHCVSVTFALNTYTVAASADPVGGGNVTGTGTFDHGYTVNLTANPATGYHFVNWTEEGVGVVSTDATYSFTATANRTLTAHFAVDRYPVIASAVPADGGTIIGNSVWTDTGGEPSSYFFLSLASYGPVLFASTYDHGVWRYDPATSTWTDTGFDVNNSDGYSSNDAYSLARGGAFLYAATDSHGVWRYDPATSTWTDTGGGVSGYSIYSFSWDGSSLYAGTDSHGVWRYDPTTSTWTDTGGGVSGYSIHSLSWDGSGLYAGTDSHGVWRYDPSTSTWTDTGGGISTSPVFSMAWDGFGLYAGTYDKGVWRYDPSTSTWADTEGGMGSYQINELLWDGSSLYAGIDSLGVWRYDPATSVWADTGDWASSSSSNVTSLALIDSSLFMGSQGLWLFSGYTHGQVVDMEASPATGYQFVNWTEGGTVVSTSENYSFTATGARTLVANFTLRTYLIEATADPLAGGTITGAGVYEHGKSVYLVATPAAGYHFVKWTEGETVISSPYICTFTVVASRALTAHFAINAYAISTKNYPPAGGSVTGAGTYTHGDTVNLVATPGTGYHFVNWTEGATEIPGEDATYSFTATAHRTLTAHFTINSYTIAASADPAVGGTVAGAGSYNHGETVNMTATPAAGHHFVNWTEEGVGMVSTNATYSFTATANRTLVAHFAINTYTITASAGEGGSITPSGTVTVNHGASKSFTITPDEGWSVADVTVDGASRGAVATVNFSSVTANHTISASFEENISPLATWYLAEGSTNWGFDCYISIVNPNSEEVEVELTYMTGSGAVEGPTVTMPAMSQATVFPSATLGAADFSTQVTCTDGRPISVDRTMYWTGPTSTVAEAHCATGVTSPATTWYMPEGSSNWGFECFVLIQNPGDTPTEATVTWMIEGASPQATNVTVGAASRLTLNMADYIGAADASIKVESDSAVICERAMYRNDRREGHDSGGTPTSAADYYLAEGCTGFGFTTYVLVQNPNNSPTDVEITYQAASGEVAGPAFTMPANSRKTICVNDTTAIPGPDPSFSTHVHGDQPIIAERAMYWNGGDDAAQVCHDSIGLAAPHTAWFLADGQTSEGRETWTLVQNPNASDVTVQVTYMTPDGTGNVVKEEIIPAFSRMSFDMASHSGITGRAAIMVVSTTGNPVMCERAMYWNNRGTGTDTIGGYAD